MVTINKLEIENVKRVKAVKLEPSATGLTIVGGNNNQGKTSVLDVVISINRAKLREKAVQFRLA